ncbi:RNA-directed DNA polymerase, eukaryota [Tanacetum coccineum]
MTKCKKLLNLNQGVPIHAWSRATFDKIGSKWGDVMEIEESKDELFARKQLREIVIVVPDFQSEMRPTLFRWKNPLVLLSLWRFCSRVMEECQQDTVQPLPVDRNSGLNGNVLKKGGSILEVLDGMVKVGQAMGYDMGGCMKDIEKIIGSQGAHDGNFRVNIPRNFFDGKEMSSFEGLLNEVRSETERRGSVFNVYGAADFNDFISNAGLIDIQLEDAICQILALFFLREVLLILKLHPFRFIHLWLSISGLILMVGKSGNPFLLMIAIDMIRFKKKLQAFQAPCDSRSKINFPFPNRLNSEQATSLETPITTDEIRSAVWACGENKSPGPDGFTFEFFRRFWDVIGPDFCLAVKWFFDHNSFAKGCNSSFIALIPKVSDPKFVNEYRPISLIGSLYKVVTKILAIRLVSVLDNLISEVQSAFLPKRQILDGPFVINEVLSWCKHKRRQAMIFKVDFAKAYDSVRWDFLDDVLLSFGFGLKWRAWILAVFLLGIKLLS